MCRHPRLINIAKYVGAFLNTHCCKTFVDCKVDAGDLAERRARDVREFTSKMITVSSMPNASVNGGALRTNGAATPHYG